MRPRQLPGHPRTRARLNSLSGRDKTVSGHQHGLFFGPIGFSLRTVGRLRQNHTNMNNMTSAEASVMTDGSSKLCNGASGHSVCGEAARPNASAGPRARKCTGRQSGFGGSAAATIARPFAHAREAQFPLGPG